MRSAGKLLLVVTLTLLPVALTSCGGGSTVYVRGTSEVVSVTAGDPAPFEGFVISPQAYIDLTECCELCLEVKE
jgi:hypothetical protein